MPDFVQRNQLRQNGLLLGVCAQTLTHPIKDKSMDNNILIFVLLIGLCKVMHFLWNRKKTAHRLLKRCNIGEPSGKPIIDSAAAQPERQLFNFVGYGFYDIVHFSQLIKNLIGVIIFYHRYMKVNTRGSIFRVFIKFATRKCC